MQKTFHKCCPKCGGYVLLDKDYNGWYEECLQCGYTCDLHAVVDRAAWQDRDETAAIPSGRQL